MKTLDGTLYRRALDCSGPQSAHTRVVSRAGCQSPLWVNFGLGRAQLRGPFYLDEPTCEDVSECTRVCGHLGFAASASAPMTTASEAS